MVAARVRGFQQTIFATLKNFAGYGARRVGFFFFQAEDGIRDADVTGVQTCALPIFGARILGPLMRDAPGALAIVRSHHERLDGSGFPDGLKGDQIPFEARLVSVADAFDAMTSVRPYRPSLSVKHAMRELEEGKGVQFDGEIVQAFLRAFAEGTSLPIPTPQLQPLRLPTRAMEARRA